MSHELRTPLNSFLILAQILADNKEHNLTTKQVKYAETIFSSGNDLLHLINDILDLAKVEDGKMEFNFEKVYLDEIKTFVEAQFTHIARQKEIDLVIELKSTMPTFIWTDKHRLQQILKNLLSNAFKFTDKGLVTLIINRKRKEYISGKNVENDTDDVFAFSVKDTGVGISLENHAAIFEAFNQIDGTTSRKYGGTGLGLSISREIAHLLQGEIEVNSMKGQGSTFTLFLPNIDYTKYKEGYDVLNEVAVGRIEESNKTPTETDTNNDYPHEGFEEVDDSKPLLKDKKILVVDDDIRNIYAITTALEIYQAEVVFAENGKEGIEILKENPDIDLILMDIMMPEMDGLEAIKVIRQMEEF
jgi:two-component system chemotaxis sensor kinase CheA